MDLYGNNIILISMFKMRFNKKCVCVVRSLPRGAVRLPWADSPQCAQRTPRGRSVSHDTHKFVDQSYNETSKTCYFTRSRLWAGSAAGEAERDWDGDGKYRFQCSTQPWQVLANGKPVRTFHLTDSYLNVCVCCRGNNGVNVDQESLLHQLTEITRVMQEGQLVEGVATTNKKDQRAWEEGTQKRARIKFDDKRTPCYVAVFRMSPSQSNSC